jgi:hypothetical protein
MFSLCSRDAKRPPTSFSAALDCQEAQRGLFTVQDANGVSVAFACSRDDLHRQRWVDYNKHLTSDEARRVATMIARIPELFGKRT